MDHLFKFLESGYFTGNLETGCFSEKQNIFSGKKAEKRRTLDIFEEM